MKQQEKAINPLYGLILSGGKSTRMGKDKGLLQYHHKPHREYLFELAAAYCDSVFYSIREEQPITRPEQAIRDSGKVRGPFNGLLSAAEKYPRASWLVLACDLPLLDAPTLEFLIAGRQPTVDATALATAASGLPEPLAAIWEPSAFKKALHFLQGGMSTCPRKFLLHPNTRTALLTVPSDDVLLNANSPEDLHLVATKLSQR